MAAREKAMRYPLGALFLTSCAMLTPLSTGNQPAEQPPAAVRERRESLPDRRPASRQLPAGAEIASCTSLDTGNLKETIKAKLDCIEESTR